MRPSPGAGRATMADRLAEIRTRHARTYMDELSDDDIEWLMAEVERLRPIVEACRVRKVWREWPALAPLFGVSLAEALAGRED